MTPLRQIEAQKRAIYASELRKYLARAKLYVIDGVMAVTLEEMLEALLHAHELYVAAAFDCRNVERLGSKIAYEMSQMGDVEYYAKVLLESTEQVAWEEASAEIRDYFLAGAERVAERFCTEDPNVRLKTARAAGEKHASEGKERDN